MTHPFHLAISPLSWTNDVLEELGGDTPIEVCLSDIRRAGFEGTELGRKFPRDSEALQRLLTSHQLKLASGWHSGFLAEQSVEAEMQAVAPHAGLLQALGAKVMVYGECGRMYPTRPLDVGMSLRHTLKPDEFTAYAVRLTAFAAQLQDQYGLTLAYHHHLMMVAETFDEISCLFNQTGKAVGLLLDTGHAAAAGFDYQHLIKRFGDRIAHIHLKDVRAEVMQRVRQQDLSFNEGVRQGMFTIPGDGSIDYSYLARFVKQTGYSGWLVIEAEQDPILAPPKEMANRAFAFMQSLF